MAFEYQGKETRSNDLSFISENIAPTPFKALIANQFTSAVDKSEIKSHLQLGLPWSQTVTQVCIFLFIVFSNFTLLLFNVFIINMCLNESFLLVL